MTFPIGVAIPAGAESGPNIVTETVRLAEQARAAGLAGVWLSQRFDTDALALSAVVGNAVADITVGTSVVPVTPRHPILVSSGAQTAQAASGGRFNLGLGLGAPGLLGPAFGSSVERPIRYLREYLAVLHELFTTGAVDHAGDAITARTPMPAGVAGADPVPVLVGGMGPLVLQAAGELADGTLPYLAGPRTLGEFVVPRITAAASGAGRPDPRVVVALPVVVTGDVDTARARAREQMEFYNGIPSYREVIAREGLDHPSDLAVIGDEAALAAAVRTYRDAGATEIILTQTGLNGDVDRRRTWAAAGALASG